MKLTTTAVISLCAVGVVAVPHVKRAAVNEGTLDLIGDLEGFKKNFYTDSVGHTAIGKFDFCVYSFASVFEFIFLCTTICTFEYT